MIFSIHDVSFVMLLLQTTFGGFALNRQFWRYFDCLYGPMADEILTTTTSTTSTTVTTSTTDTGIEASTSEPTAVSSTEPLQAVQEVAGDDVMGENKAVGSWPSRVTQFAADWPSRKIESTADVEAEGEATTTPVVHASPTAPPAAPPAAAASPADEPIPGVLALALAHVFSSGELASYLEKGVVVAASGLLEDEVDDDDRSDASEASLDRLYSELFPNDDSEAGQKVAAPLASIKIDHKHSDKGFGGAINRITCSLKFDPHKLLSGLLPATTAVVTTALPVGPVGSSDDDEVVDETKAEALLLVLKEAGRIGATLTQILTALSTSPPETNEGPSSSSSSDGVLVDKDEVLRLLTVCQARCQILRLEGPNRLQMYAVSRSQPIATDTQLPLERYVHHEYASLYSVSFLDTPTSTLIPTPTTSIPTSAMTHEADEGGCPWVTPSGQLNTQLYNTLRAKVISLLIDKPGSPFLQIHIALHILTCTQTRLFLSRLESKERLLYSERAAETLKTTPTPATSRSIWDSPVSDKREEQQVGQGVGDGEGELWHIVHSTHYYLLSI